jgi:hypothetical protein
MLIHTCTHAHAHIYKRTQTVVACVCIYICACMHIYMQEIGCDIVHVSYVDCSDTRLCQAGWEFLCWGDETCGRISRFNATKYLSVKTVLDCDSQKPFLPLLSDFFLVATDETRK